MKFIYIVTAFTVLVSSLWAAGPAKVASFDRSVVPIEINSRRDFNTVSRIEICFFVTELASVSQWNQKDQFQKFLSREKINMPSIEKWITTTQTRLLKLYNASSADQPFTKWNEKRVPQVLGGWGELSRVAQNTIKDLPPSFAQWKSSAAGFYKTYLFEQVRLAALFPTITSEIHTLDSSESQGFEYEDGHFLLTFDDGPTPTGGNTDKIIKQLNDAGISGTFFVLGNKLKQRLKERSPKELEILYKGHRLESHGKLHKAHPKLNSWKESLDFTRKTVNSVQPNEGRTYFRPPYGQRSREQVAYLKERNEVVMLWNIDSQDWNGKISSKAMSDRVITLMLLWRSGILLFHDVHSKVQSGLPQITEFTQKAELHWVDSQKL